MSEKTAAIELDYRGERVQLVKRPVHQWRTDLVLTARGREFTIARVEHKMTRGEARAIARAWLVEYPDRWRWSNIVRRLRG